MSVYMRCPLCGGAESSTGHVCSNATHRLDDGGSLTCSTATCQCAAKDQRIAVLEAENADLNAVFELQHRRMNEATTLWRKATGKYDTSPDLGYLLMWLMKQLKQAERERNEEWARLHTPRPLEEWHEDMGPVLWHRFPICEPPHCGTPLDSDFPYGEEIELGWTPLPNCNEIQHRFDEARKEYEG